MPIGWELAREIRETKLPPGRAAFWWLGQMGYAFKLAGKTIFIDPYLSEEGTRVFAPVLRAEMVDCADLVIGTHDHGDHIDYPAWRVIAEKSPRALFVCPAMHVRRLAEKLGIGQARFLGVEDGQAVEAAGISITGVASAHELLDRDPQTGSYPYMGYLLRGEGITFYHAGDTCLYAGLESKLRAQGRIDAAFLPINGRSGYKLATGTIGNMTFQEAVDLTGALGPRLAVPGHFEMHAVNLENPVAFQHYLHQKYPQIDCWIGRHGEKVIMGRGEGVLTAERWPQ